MGVPLLFYSRNLSSTHYTVYDENIFPLEKLLGSLYQKHCCVDSFFGVYDFTLKPQFKHFFMLFCTI
jgi:hypothetical protein